MCIFSVYIPLLLLNIINRNPFKLLFLYSEFDFPYDLGRFDTRVHSLILLDSNAYFLSKHSIITFEHYQERTLKVVLYSEFDLLYDFGRFDARVHNLILGEECSKAGVSVYIDAEFTQVTFF